jgi:hypothetical protein
MNRCPKQVMLSAFLLVVCFLVTAPAHGQWLTPPYQTGTNSIAMVATTATDLTPPVSYYFDFVGSPTGGLGGTDSGWQAETSYTNSNLRANHKYGRQCMNSRRAGTIRMRSIRGSTLLPLLSQCLMTGLTYGKE